MWYNVITVKETILNIKKGCVLMSRQDFYEMCFESMGMDEMSTYFGVEVSDPRDFDYDFGKVAWNYNLEMAYCECCSEDEEEG